MIKPFEKSWDEGQEVKFNFYIFFPDYYLFMNIFIDFFDVLIIVEVQQPDGSLLTYI